MAFFPRSSRNRRGLTRAAASALMLLGAGIVASLVTPGCTEVAGTTPEGVCPAGQSSCQIHLTLLHTADIHSRLFDYDLLINQTDAELGLGTQNDVVTVGGIARLSYVINRERARSDRVLHLDSGDVFQGAPIFNYFHGEPEVRAMNQIFPDAMVIGNHEYDDGALNVANEFMRWKDFPLLGANYQFYDIQNPFSTRMAALLKPFEVLTVQGLRVAVIGMGNLSTLGSLFSQPNNLGMVPLNTAEVAQTYIDLLRPYVDFVVVLSHLGLDADQAMVEQTTGIDIVLGGHNHIVINPPQQLQDCTADPSNPGYVWAVDPNIAYDTNTPPPPVDPKGVPLPDPINNPYEFQRKCTPRKVIIEHSGAFSKYLGRDDLILSNNRDRRIVDRRSKRLRPEQRLRDPVERVPGLPDHHGHSARPGHGAAARALPAGPGCGSRARSPRRVPLTVLLEPHRATRRRRSAR